mgnify:FL=1
MVDDDEDVLITAEVVLKQKFKSIQCLSVPSFIPELFERTSFDVVLLDMNYQTGDASGEEGLKWLTWIREMYPSTQVMMITAYGEVNLAVEAMKLGAVDFVTKPWQYADIQQKVLAAYELGQKRETVELVKRSKRISRTAQRDLMIGDSPKMVELRSLIQKVAPTQANVLILGENGTGKELAAKAIYEASDRSNKPFVQVDMGAITESLFESELFGHAKGAFTDAKADRVGRFEAAHGGTIFLDEIGNLTLRMQSKLLSVLQRRVVTRVGEHLDRPIDVRVIAATNANLEELVASREFREDLLYRLNTIELTLPALRERGKDVLSLSEYFISKLNKKYAKEVLSLSETAKKELIEYQWPGNIRELEHTLERAVIMAQSAVIESSDLLLKSSHTKSSRADTTNLEELEKQTIQEVIQKCDGNMSKVAKELGIGRTTLYRKIEKYGL